MKGQSPEGFQDSGTTSCDTVMAVTCHSSSAQTHGAYNTGSEAKVNCGFGVITTCQWRFSLSEKCAVLVSDADNAHKEAVTMQGQPCPWSLCTFLSILV